MLLLFIGTTEVVFLTNYTPVVLKENKEDTLIKQMKIQNSKFKKQKTKNEIKATGPRMAHGFAEIQRQTGEDPYGTN